MHNLFLNLTRLIRRRITLLPLLLKEDLHLPLCNQCTVIYMLHIAVQIAGFRCLSVLRTETEIMFSSTLSHRLFFLNGLKLYFVMKALKYSLQPFPQTYALYFQCHFLNLSNISFLHPYCSLSQNLNPSI